MNIKSKEECAFDLISLGEVMLRLDPGEGRPEGAEAREEAAHLPAGYQQLAAPGDKLLAMEAFFRTDGR